MLGTTTNFFYISSLSSLGIIFPYVRAQIRIACSRCQISYKNFKGAVYSGTCFKFLNISLSELPAFMLVDITSFAKDLELPGLPTTNNGMRSSVQIAIINTFSLRGIFLAIF